MSVIDFTSLQKRKKAYAGANGNKISIIYEGEQYMLKFPPAANRNKDMSYSNSCFSEYLGCQIYESIGVPVQKTILGTFTVRGREKIMKNVLADTRERDGNLYVDYYLFWPEYGCRKWFLLGKKSRN